MITNLSGGPREIFLAFTIACLSCSGEIFKTTNYSDIEKRLSVFESTVSSQVARLAELGALDVFARGKTKEVRITLAGKILL